jgi:hypothetical protein
MIDFEADIDGNWLDLNGFAESVAYTPLYGTEKTISILLMREYEPSDLSDLARAGAYTILAYAKTSALTGKIRGGLIVDSAGARHYIKEVQLLNGGITMLEMSFDE